MPGANTIQVKGSVIEVLPNTLLRVELGNGHKFLARRNRLMREGNMWPGVGDEVTVEMSPCDMSKGCIVDYNQKTKT